MQNISKNDLEQLEELLYTLEIEEELAHHELVEQQLSLKKREDMSQQLPCTNNTQQLAPARIENSKFPSKVSGSNNLNPCIHDEELAVETLSRERQEEIYNYGWSFKKSTPDVAKDLTKNGKLEQGCLFNSLTESILDSCIAGISSDIEAIVQESAEQIFQTL